MAFSLELADAEVIKKEVLEEIKPTPEESTKLMTFAETQGGEVMAVNLDSIESRREITDAINSFGQEVVTKTDSKNAMLQKRLVNLGDRSSGAIEVAQNLEELAIQMKDLDPSPLDFTKKGLLGKLANPVRRYFEKYKTADQEIAAIIKTLDNGKKTLINDNTTLEIEEVNMRNLARELMQKTELGNQLDAFLQNAIDEERAKGGDEDRIRFVEEEVLFPLRQRIMDFQQLLTVNQQGIVAMEVIRKNNSELIRSVDRAKTVTVASLRTAVTVAGALYDQKIVLEKINTLNAATNNMISATSKLLKEQGTEIQRQATEANISPEVLKNAFADAISALDDIYDYRQKALPQMKNTIDEFRQMAIEGQKQVDRIERREKMLLGDQSN